MIIALIGYGKMGKEIEKIAISRGHKIGLKIDITNQDDSEVGYAAGLGLEIGTASGLAIDGRVRINIIPINDGSKKSAAVTVGLNYLLGKKGE